MAKKQPKSRLEKLRPGAFKRQAQKFIKKQPAENERTLDTTSVTETSLEKQKREILKRARIFIRPLTPAKHKALFITAGIVTGFVLVFIGVFALLIYRYQSDHPLVYQVSRIIPYPAAQINGSYVSYGDYLFELRPLKHFFSNPSGPAAGAREAVDFSTPEGEQQLRQLERVAFDEMAKKTLVRQLAARHDIKVGRSELEEAMDNQINQAGGERQFKEVISLYYQWTEGDFRRDLEDKLLRRKLLPVLSVKQKAQADKLLARIRDGADFSKLAKENSADPGSRSQGGDLGAAPLGTYVKEFEEAALLLAPGQVSNVVASQHGFHIIKLIDKSEDSLHAAHILINYADFDAAIASERAAAQVDNCFLWDKACIEVPPLPDETGESKAST